MCWPVSSSLSPFSLAWPESSKKGNQGNTQLSPMGLPPQFIPQWLCESCSTVSIPPTAIDGVGAGGRDAAESGDTERLWVALYLHPH